MVDLSELRFQPLLPASLQGMYERAPRARSPSPGRMADSPCRRRRRRRRRRAAASRPAEAGPRWTCDSCTLLNSASAKRCKACGAANPTLPAKPKRPKRRSRRRRPLSWTTTTTATPRTSTSTVTPAASSPPPSAARRGRRARAAARRSRIATARTARARRASARAGGTRSAARTRRAPPRARGGGRFASRRRVPAPQVGAAAGAAAEHGRRRAVDRGSDRWARPVCTPRSRGVGAGHGRRSCAPRRPPPLSWPRLFGRLRRSPSAPSLFTTPRPLPHRSSPSPALPQVLPPRQPGRLQRLALARAQALRHEASARLKYKLITKNKVYGEVRCVARAAASPRRLPPTPAPADAPPRLPLQLHGGRPQEALGWQLRFCAWRRSTVCRA